MDPALLAAIHESASRRKPAGAASRAPSAASSAASSAAAASKLSLASSLNSGKLGCKVRTLDLDSSSDEEDDRPNPVSRAPPPPPPKAHTRQANGKSDAQKALEGMQNLGKPAAPTPHTPPTVPTPPPKPAAPGAPPPPPPPPPPNAAANAPPAPPKPASIPPTPPAPPKPPPAPPKPPPAPPKPPPAPPKPPPAPPKPSPPPPKPAPPAAPPSSSSSASTSALEQEVARLRDELEASRRDAQEYRAAASRAQEERRELETKIESSNSSSASETRRLKAEIERMMSDHANEVSRMRRQHGEEIAKASSGVSAAQAETDAIRKKLDAAESGHRAELATAARERASLQDTLAEVRRELDTALHDKTTTERELEAAGTEVARLKARMETALSDRSDAQAEAAKVRAERDNLSRMVGRQRREIEAVRVAVGAPSRAPPAPSAEAMRASAVSFAGGSPPGGSGRLPATSVSALRPHPLYEAPEHMKIAPSMTGTSEIKSRRDTTFIEQTGLAAELAKNASGRGETNDASLNPFMGFLGSDTIEKLPEIKQGELVNLVKEALENASSGSDSKVEAAMADGEAAEKRERERADTLLQELADLREKHKQEVYEAEHTSAERVETLEKQLKEVREKLAKTENLLREEHASAIKSRDDNIKRLEAAVAAAKRVFTACDALEGVARDAGASLSGAKTDVDADAGSMAAPRAPPQMSAQLMRRAAMAKLAARAWRDNSAERRNVGKPVTSPADIKDAAATLEASAIFGAGLKERPDLIQRLAQKASMVCCPAGGVLILQGQTSDNPELYVVDSGSLDVVLGAGESGRKPGKLLHTALRGEVLGEVAVVLGEPRAATVRVSHGGDAILFVFAKNDVDEVLSDAPDVLDELRKIARKRKEEAVAADGPTLKPAAVLLTLTQREPKIGDADTELPTTSSSDSGDVAGGADARVKMLGSSAALIKSLKKSVETWSSRAGELEAELEKLAESHRLDLDSMKQRTTAALAVASAPAPMSAMDGAAEVNDVFAAALAEEELRSEAEASRTRQVQLEQDTARLRLALEEAQREAASLRGGYQPPPSTSATAAIAVEAASLSTSTPATAYALAPVPASPGVTHSGVVAMGVPAGYAVPSQEDTAAASYAPSPWGPGGTPHPGLAPAVSAQPTSPLARMATWGTTVATPTTAVAMAPSPMPYYTGPTLPLADEQEETSRSALLDRLRSTKDQVRHFGDALVVVSTPGGGVGGGSALPTAPGARRPPLSPAEAHASQIDMIDSLLHQLGQ